MVPIAALARRPWAGRGHLLVGLMLIGWIGVQLLVIGPSSALQPVMAAWGLAAALGAVHVRRRGPGAGTATPRG